MARGDNPNSRANLRPLQPGLPEKAQREIQKKGSDAGNKVQAEMRSYYDLAKDNVPLEHKLAHIQKLDEMAQNGDIKALELLLKILKEYEDRLAVESDSIEIHFNAV